jgi:AAA+ ATPase superfamily predicted ATPase
MEGFVGRSKELGILNEIYSRKGPVTCAVYGRRRIGKTSLLREFCRDKNHIFLSAAESGEQENGERFSRAIEVQTGKVPKETDRFYKILDFLKTECVRGRTILVIDEFPFLAASTGVSSDVQKFIDIDMKDTEIMLIICGSSLSAMADEIDGRERPLFGRFPNRIRLGPMDYRECRLFHENMDADDNMSLYLAVGGVPFYHASMTGKTFKSCIKQGFLEEQAFLRSEADDIVSRELSPASHHRSILSAIAKGSTQLKEIAEKCSLSSQLCQKYLNNLIFLECVEIVQPMGDSPKRPVYRICDNLLAFHFSVIQKNGNLIETADPDVSFTRILPEINTCLGHAFEGACASYVRNEYPCIKIGKWWGRVGDTDTDIDVVAVITDGTNDQSLFAECKYTRRKTDVIDMEELIECSSYVRGLMNHRYCIISRSGFTTALEDAAHERGVRLVGLDDMYSKTVHEKKPEPGK